VVADEAATSAKARAVVRVRVAVISSSVPIMMKNVSAVREISRIAPRRPSR